MIFGHELSQMEYPHFYGLCETIKSYLDVNTVCFAITTGRLCHPFCISNCVLENWWNMANKRNTYVDVNIVCFAITTGSLRQPKHIMDHGCIATKNPLQKVTAFL